MVLCFYYLNFLSDPYKNIPQKTPVTDTNWLTGLVFLVVVLSANIIPCKRGVGMAWIRSKCTRIAIVMSSHHTTSHPIILQCSPTLRLQISKAVAPVSNHIPSVSGPRENTLSSGSGFSIARRPGPGAADLSSVLKALTISTRRRGC